MSRRRTAVMPRTRLTVMAGKEKRRDAQGEGAAAGDDQHSARPAVPGAVLAPEAGQELEHSQERKDRGADDVQDQRHREGFEAGVGWDEVRASGELDEAQRPR